MDDVLALQTSGGFGLDEESFDELVFDLFARVKELEGYFVSELRVTRGDNSAHSADRENTIDDIATGKDIALFNGRRVVLGLCDHTPSLIVAQQAYGPSTMAATFSTFGGRGRWCTVSVMRRAFFFLPAGLVIAIGCQWIAGINDRNVWDGSTVSPDGSILGDPCSEIGIPPAPNPQTSKPTDTGDVTFALYSVNTGTDKGNVVRSWGFNLDRRCTCPGPAACAVMGDMFCDYEAGVDDEGVKVFRDLQMFAQQVDAGGFFADTLFNSALQKGESGLLVRMRNYNGQADDAEVQVAIYSSPKSMAMPNWNGNDQWNVDSSFISANNVDLPLYEVAGWVTNHTLVASPAQIPIVIGSMAAQPVRVRLDSGRIVAKIDMNGTQITGINGVLAGRWKAVEFLQNLQGVPDPQDMSKHLCGDGTGDAGLSITYLAIRSAVCKHRDLNSNPDNDDKNFVCDAVSFGIGFEAKTARLGAPLPPPNPVYGCGSGWKASCP